MHSTWRRDRRSERQLNGWSSPCTAAWNPHCTRGNAVLTRTRAPPSRPCSRAEPVAARKGRQTNTPHGLWMSFLQSFMSVLQSLTTVDNFTTSPTSPTSPTWRVGRAGANDFPNTQRDPLIPERHTVCVCVFSCATCRAAAARPLNRLADPAHTNLRLSPARPRTRRRQCQHLAHHHLGPCHAVRHCACVLRRWDGLQRAKAIRSL